MYGNFKEKAIEYVRQVVAEDCAGNFSKAEKIRAVVDEGGSGPALNGDSAVTTRPKTKPRDGNEREDGDKEKLRAGLNSGTVREMPNVKWNGITGLESEEQALQEAVILPVKFPQFFTGTDENLQGFAATESEVQTNGGYNNTVNYYVRVMASRCVCEELEKFKGPEERKLPYPCVPFLLFPRGPRSQRKFTRKGRDAFSHVAGTSASVKSLKRKNKPKSKLSDSEVIIPCRLRSRGQVRRVWNSSFRGATERMKLDSATFFHYFMHIWNDFSEEKVNSIAFFDPLWFNLYVDEKNRSMVLDWIKEMDIFSKKYVLVPIVLWSHWSLLIFCNLGEDLYSKNDPPCLLLLDSLHAIGPKRLEPLIRRLLVDIYKTEGRMETTEQLKKMPLLIPKVPQQKKGEECGYIVLYYVNLFIESGPENFNTMHGYPYFMNKDWFSVEGLESFYKRLDSFPVISNDNDDSATTIFADKFHYNTVICLD